MSSYYKPNRNPNWNYNGGRWKLSRSKIDLFKNCARCFYIDNKLGTARPPGFPFNLNSAVDALFKKEFDVHRNNHTPHPIMEQYGIKAIPFEHENMDMWRENFEGIQVQHAATGFTVSGAIDDIWVDTEGVLYVVDYKSTSKKGKIEALDQDWHIGYKRQMEVYQWLLRESGFTVSDTGYFVYANAKQDVEKFDSRLDFEVTLISYTGNAQWVNDTLLHIKQCLNDPRIPKASSDCDYCRYREAVGKNILKNKEMTTETDAKVANKPNEPDSNEKKTLF